jgi:deoxyribose-phosphate aldolase
MIEKWSKEQIAQHIQFTNVNPELDLIGIKEHLRICMDYGFQAAMISPCWVGLARKALAGSGVKIATTVNFPQATDTAAMKVAVVRLLAREGADEFDFPPNPAFLLSGMEEEYFLEIAAVSAAARDEGLVVKAMLEFGYLPAPAMRAKATELASRAGADWVKNSSGWGKGGSPATVEDVLILKANVAGTCRVKVSGKVNSLEKMDALFAAGAELVGTSSGPAIVDGRTGGADAY